MKKTGSKPKLSAQTSDQPPSASITTNDANLQEERLKQSLRKRLRPKYPITPDRISQLFQAIIRLGACRLNTAEAGALMKVILDGDYLSVAGSAIEFSQDVLGWPPEKTNQWLECFREGRWAEVDDLVISSPLAGGSPNGQVAEPGTLPSEGSSKDKAKHPGRIELAILKSGTTGRAAANAVEKESPATTPPAEPTGSSALTPDSSMLDESDETRTPKIALEQQFDAHPLAAALPLPGDEEIACLAQDILINGLNEPIVLFEGKILDGRTRDQACLKVGAQRKFVDYKGDSPAQFVISKNIHRRNLTPSQKAVAAAELLPFLEVETKLRRDQTQRLERDTKGRLTKSPDPEKVPGVEADAPKSASVAGQKGEAREKAGKAMGVNARYISDAKLIKESDPELFTQLKSGAITLAAAKKALKAKSPQTTSKSEQNKKSSGSAKQFNSGPAWKKLETLLIGVVESWPKDAHGFLADQLEEFAAKKLRGTAQG